MLSVITVNYNDFSGLKNTVESIQKQTSLQFEHIVIDGGSTDGSVEFVKSQGIKYISEPDTGIYNAMNKGIDMSSGDYLIFMNAGDTFTDKNCIENIIAEMDQNTGFDIYYSDAIYIRENSEYIHCADHNLIMSKMPFNHQSTAIRRKLHQQLKYSEFYKISSDYDFFLRAHKSGASFFKIKTRIARHSLDGISVTSPFHSCIESVHSHLMHFKSLEWDKSEYYGELFIREIFKGSSLANKLALALYVIFIKKDYKNFIKYLKRKCVK